MMEHVEPPCSRRRVSEMQSTRLGAHSQLMWGKHSECRATSQHSDTAGRDLCRLPWRRRVIQSHMIVLQRSSCQRSVRSKLQRDPPFGSKASSGQSFELPEHVSALSHRASTAGRQTVPAEASWHCSVQQSELRVLQTAPATNLQVERSQQASSVDPGSQSSPASTIPLPQD